MRHQRHVAVRVVQVFAAERAGGRIAWQAGGGQAVADFGTDDLGQLGIAVPASPIAGAHDVGHGEQVANRVIAIGLGVGAHRVSVTGLRQAGAERAERVVVGDLLRWRQRGAGLAQMLAAGGRDQPVHWVVGVTGRRLDPLVPEEDHVLSVGAVGDLGDVPDRVVVVGQVLDALLAGGKRTWPGGGEVRQPEGLRIVAVGGACPVAEGDRQPLAAGVVLDAGHGVPVGAWPGRAGRPARWPAAAIHPSGSVAPPRRSPAAGRRDSWLGCGG